MAIPREEQYFTEREHRQMIAEMERRSLEEIASRVAPYVAFDPVYQQQRLGWMKKEADNEEKLILLLEE